MSSTKPITDKQQGPPNHQLNDSKKPDDGSVQSDTNQKDQQNQKDRKDQMNSPRGKVPSR
jgi:hypothetical protein